MRISDLSYLEDVSELPSVTGGIDVTANAAINSAYFPIGYGGFLFNNDVSANTYSSPQIVESSASGASVIVAATPGSSVHAYARSGNTSVEATI